jgi:hypothetical protein
LLAPSTHKRKAKFRKCYLQTFEPPSPSSSSLVLPDGPSHTLPRRLFTHKAPPDLPLSPPCLGSTLISPPVITTFSLLSLERYGTGGGGRLSRGVKRLCRNRAAQAAAVRRREERDFLSRELFLKQHQLGQNNHFDAVMPTSPSVRRYFWFAAPRRVGSNRTLREGKEADEGKAKRVGQLFSRSRDARRTALLLSLPFPLDALARFPTNLKQRQRSMGMLRHRKPSKEGDDVDIEAQSNDTAVEEEQGKSNKSAFPASLPPRCERTKLILFSPTSAGVQGR